MNQDADQIFARILIGLGTLFIEFCFQVGRPGDQKTLIFLRFLSFFTISANLPTRSHMIDFLINLALNLTLKIHQKSTQEPPKINKNSIKNNIQQIIPFFIVFSRFGRPLGPQVGPMLRPCWPQNPQKRSFANNPKKTLKKQTPDKVWSGIFRDPGVP